jgi:VanZ family protein
MEGRHFTRLAQLAAWLSTAIIVYLTMAHVGVVYSIYNKLAPWLMRPSTTNYVVFEHIIAFALFGAVFCITYPRRTFMVCCIVFVSIIALELMQTLTPDRHGTLSDALEKIVGGGCGIFIAKCVINLRKARLPNRCVKI